MLIKTNAYTRTFLQYPSVLPTLLSSIFDLLIYFICQCFMFQFGYTFEATVGDTETVVVRKGEAAVLVKKMLLK